VTVDSLQYLQCVPAGPTEVVLSSPALDCHSDQYRTRLWFAYFMLISWVVLLPLSLAVFLIRLRRQRLLRDITVLERWGFLYATFRPSFFWCEPALLLRRCVISTMAVAFATHPAGRTEGLGAVLVLSLVLQMWLRPYAHASSNAWETASLTSLLLLTLLTNDFSIIRASEYPLHVQVLASLLVAIMSSSLLLTLLRGRFLHIACVRRLDASLTDCWQYVTRTDASQGQGRRSSSKAAFIAAPELDYPTLTSGELSSDHSDDHMSLRTAFPEHPLLPLGKSARDKLSDDHEPVLQEPSLTDTGDAAADAEDHYQRID